MRFVGTCLFPKSVVQFKERDMMRVRRNPEAYAALMDEASRPTWTDVFVKEDGGDVTGEALRQKFPKLKRIE